MHYVFYLSFVFKRIYKELHDRVIVKRVEEEQTTKGGIIIPDTAKEKPQEGIITAVGSGRIEGEGKKKIPLEVKKGDRVLFSKYAGSEITIDGEEQNSKVLILRYLRRKQWQQRKLSTIPRPETLSYRA
jgi:chaperonin GroES